MPSGLHRSRVGIALLCAFAFLGTARAQQSNDTDGLSEDRITITDLSQPGSPGKTFAATTIINAPLQKLCGIILDYPRYPQFMPNTAKTEVVQTADAYSLVDMTLSLPLGKIKRYRLKMEPAAGRRLCRLSWKLVPREDLTPDDTIADTAGYWRLTPYPSDPGRTAVEYFVYADPGPVPFGLGWIVDIMSRESLPKTLEALRERAASP